MPHLPDGKGFVVLCDAAGTIEQITQNDYELMPQFSIGIPIKGFFDEACREKVSLFLEETRSKGAAFGWELVVPLQGGPATVH